MPLTLSSCFGFLRQKVAEPQYGKWVYSQEGEDLLLLRQMGIHAERGTYVDVGANHPFRMSNTALFYQRGWRGVAIDPNPSFGPLFKQLRPDDIFFNCGVGSSEEEMPYYMFQEALYNTFDRKRALEVAQSHSPLIGEAMVPMKPLKSLLKSCWPEGRHITLLSVDSEGFDRAVLESHDFSLYPVEFILTEVHATAVEDALASPVVSYLRSLGFAFISKLCNTCCFAHVSALTKYGL